MAILRPGLKPTLSGAEGSSRWGSYVPGVAMREQELGGLCNRISNF